MGLETGSTIASFITSNPTSSDPVNQGDDHLRLIKSVLQAQFPGSGGLGYATAIAATETELNYVHGVTSNIQTQINNILPSGTRMPFAQAAAPTGWTQDGGDNANNRMLRVVNTAGGGVGGSASPVLNNTVPAHTHGFLTGGQNQNHVHFDSGHTHVVYGVQYGGAEGGGNTSLNTSNNGNVTSAPSNANIGVNNVDHTHSGGTDNGSSQTNWTPRYINMIICSKN
jgi:hypothetical protein